jgi:hypothetical protein
MKKYIIPSIGLLVGLSLIVGGFVANKKPVNRIDGLIKTQYVCPDCGEWGCIYEDIDTRYDQGTDIEIETAIYEVCKERNITDQKTIDLIKANYYL